MIIDIDKFVRDERPYWDALETMLRKLEDRVEARLYFDDAKQFHYLYRRAASDLARVKTFAAEQELAKYLEYLVSRAYAEIHEARREAHRFNVLRWFFRSFPQAFRRHRRAFYLSVAVTCIGAVLGGGILLLDPDSKSVILPFAHLQGNPSDRVDQEESATEDQLEGFRSQFSAELMTNNISVSIKAMAFGVAWGFGTLLVLFFNGVILGAVVVDYVLAGESVFLAGWLLPHGSVEIPSILLAGQAGFVVGHAMIGYGPSITLRARLRQASSDIVTLVFGLAILLVWAGLVEAFLSQYHEPTIPYWLKISFGVVELIVLFLFLSRAGREAPDNAEVGNSAYSPSGDVPGLSLEEP